MNENQSIKDTLSIIRKALEDDEPIKSSETQDNILILNKLVKDDGTINVLNETSISKDNTIKVLNNKLDEVFDDHLSKWLDKNIPDYLEKYFKKKDI
jgi:hypothetical protein|tara:strand:+ start:1647 stop:1937 length:291 start_codon:yes stop_codon:yes gene_type:complete